MNKKTGIVLFLCLLGLMSLRADLPVPPPWIYGQWQTILEGKDGEPISLLLIFLPGDILINSNSVLQMIQEGYINSFDQQISGDVYTIRAGYADGFWWEESFPMPVMTSVYIDKSYEEGDYSTMTYQFLPLGMIPLYEVPNDFE
ncbi:MAG: hypothetical protein LBH07_06180 [Treponema sp.]|jgi:hypothetical protein|nr:hypothetical protein [Treponema sp.]